MKLDPKFKRRWLAALRKPVSEGGYLKGTGALVETRLGLDHFCCLGVAADLLVKDGTVPDGWTGSSSVYGQVDGQTNYLPQNLRRQIGLNDEAQRRLAQINDQSGYSRASTRFDAVIKHIKENL